MARKKRKKRGRPKKSKITYDSQEVKFVLGLIFLSLGIFSVLSYIITDDQGVFGFLRAFFGEATFVFAFFLINMAIKFFGGEYLFTSRKSLIGQLLVVVNLSVYISAIASPQDLLMNSYEGQFGGIIGYELANFSENFFLLNFTSPVTLIILILLIPIVANQSLASFMTNIGKGILSIISFFVGKKNEKEDESKQNKVEDNSNSENFKPSMFSHFRRENDKSKPGIETPTTKTNEVEDKPNPDFVGISNLLKKDDESDNNEGDNGVKVKTVSKDERDNDEYPSLKFPEWKLPPSSLLDNVPKLEVPRENVDNNKLIIEQTLQSFGIESKVMEVMVGPSVTQYALDIALGIKVSKIANLKNDLALALATSASAVRIEVPIPGTSYVGIEVPNTKRQPVFFRELIESTEMKNPKYILPVSVGKDISGSSVVGNIQKMPHLLIAGATGSGKSVLTNSFITSLLMRKSPDEVRFILVDPKQVELSDYNGIPHLLTPVIVDMDKVTNALKWAVNEMEERYTLFRENKVKNLEGYNEKYGFSALPYIVIVIDEMADMMLTANRAEVENNIVRLAQKARATGIHLILATQRPSVNVITGLIKANIPGRIGMSVTTQTDSRVILDYSGAESLLGKGDMLYKEPDKNKPNRVQGVFVSQAEIQRVVKFIKDQAEEVEYIEDITIDKAKALEAESAAGSASGDTLFNDAVKIVISEQKGSASLLQRKLSIGYNRAAKLIDEMEEVGVVGPAKGSKPRDVMIADADSFLEGLK